MNTFIMFFQTHFSQMTDLSLEVKLHCTYFCMNSTITLRRYNFIRLTRTKKVYKNEIVHQIQIILCSVTFAFCFKFTTYPDCKSK